MKDTTKGIFAALGNAIVIGFVFLFIKLALGVSNPIDLLSHRFLIAFIVIVIAALILKEPLLIKKKDFIAILPLGIFFPVLFFTLQVFGLEFIPTAEAGIIQATIPIFTVFLASLILKEKATLAQKVFTFISVAGVMLTFLNQGISTSGEVSGHLLGVILVTLSCLASAFYNIVARKITQEYSMFKLMYVMTIMGFIAFTLMSIGQHIFNPNLTNYWTPFLDPGYVVSIVYMGIVAFLLSAYFSNYALSKMPAGKMSVIGNISIVITILSGVIILKETLGVLQIVGTALIILGVVGANRSNKNLK